MNAASRSMLMGIACVSVLAQQQVPVGTIPLPPSAPPRLGTISGRVITSDKVPLSGVRVTYLRLPPISGPISKTLGTVTLGDGGFVFAGLPSGSYTICVQSASTALWLDPCLWSDTPVVVNLLPGQILSGQTVQVPKATTLEVNIADPQGIVSTNEAKPTGGPILPGVWNRRQMFISAGMVNKTSSSRSFQMPVPPGVPLKLGVLTSSYQVLNDAGAIVQAGIINGSFTASPTAAKSSVYITVTGLKQQVIGTN